MSHEAQQPGRLLFNIALEFGDPILHTLVLHISAMSLSREDSVKKRISHNRTISSSALASAPVDCVATCSCNGRPFVMNHAIASTANFAPALCSGNTTDTLESIRFLCH